MAAGGELFVQGNATVADNTITSEGDRYLDIDPDPTLPSRPRLLRNRTTVEIITSPNVQRVHFWSCGPKTMTAERRPTRTAVPGRSRHRQRRVHTGPSANWVLEELEIEGDDAAQHGAKLNLTDRPGFEFHGPGVHETVYVKKLKLHPYAVLNTALQMLYYEQLILVDAAGVETVWTGGLPYPETFSNGAKIVDVPLLGFSLGIVAMNDTRPRRSTSLTSGFASGCGIPWMSSPIPRPHRWRAASPAWRTPVTR